MEDLKNRICPYCKQEYKTKIGLSNWKNLFRKPTLDDWITLIIIVLVLFSAYAYKIDTQTCRAALENATLCMPIAGGTIHNTSLIFHNQSIIINATP
jgi:hypothetical protein